MAADRVGRARERLEHFSTSRGPRHWCALFAAVHFAPVPGQVPSHGALARQFGLSRDQVRYALSMAEKRFNHLLEDEVRQEVGTAADLDAELAELLAILAR